MMNQHKYKTKLNYKSKTKHSNVPKPAIAMVHVTEPKHANKNACSSML